MHLEHRFAVPVPIEQAWTVLVDIGRVAPCMPGASVDSVTGDRFTGTVKLRIGPLALSYEGAGRLIDVDEDQRTAVIEASGKEARGSGTVKIAVRARLTDRGDTTETALLTDLIITGRPALLGRGLMAEVGDRLVGRFADCLSSELARASGPVSTEPAAVGPGSGPATTERPRAAAEPFDVLEVAGVPLFKRAAGAAAGATLAGVATWLTRRRR
ncbi:MAG: SRPBCC family protein [Actinomycetota bacterium]|nr:SRPBCC family protein [Actinomycetota bacterium]